MPLRGAIRNVALAPSLGGDLDEQENFIPSNIRLANGRMTDALHWRKRPGFGLKWDVGELDSIDLLIPEDNGYAVTRLGNVYRLNSIGTSRKLSGQLKLGTRPQWTNFDGTIVVLGNSRPQKIVGNTIVPLDTAAPNGKWIDSIDDFVVIAGIDATKFQWNNAGDLDDWPESNFANVQSNGESTKFFQVLRRDMFFFKDKSIEIWNNTGSSQQFARRYVIARGTQSGDSVVQANDTFYFLGDDGDFYTLNGVQPVKISDSIRRRLDEINTKTDCYGFDFQKENVIRWFFPTEGVTLVFDYMKKVWSEDYTWTNGCAGRMPINSYMELNNKSYIGDFNRTGKIYTWSESVRSDDGEEIRVERRFTIPLTQSGNTARVNRIQFRTKSNEGDADSKKKFFWRSRIDREHWSDLVDVEIGGKGDNDPYHNDYNIGTGRELEIEILETDAVDFLVTHVGIAARENGR